MIMNNNRAKAVVAICVVVMLGVLGIDRIGGVTWTSTAASVEAGWYARSGAFTPPPAPVMRAFIIPVIMVLAVIAVALLGALFKRYSNRAGENATAATSPADKPTLVP